MADAKLNSLGQLVSNVEEIAPIVVSSSARVPNLNADMVDGIEESKLLRTDDARILSSTLTVGDTGTIQVSGTGKVRIGNFNLKQINNVLSFSYEE